jgi:hypothetical protein
LGKRRLSTIAVALFVAWLGVAPGAAAQGTQAAREQVGKPVQAAEQLLKQKKLKEALAKLREADAVPNKSPYEIYVIEATRAAVDLDAADDPAAIKALEAALSTGILPPAEAVQRVATMAQLAYRIKDYPAVVTYAERYYNEGGGDPAPRLLMAQAYYLRDDFADAAKTSRLVLQDAEKAGKPPSETVLQMLASSEFKQGNEAGYRAALTRLVAAYPKRQYWIDLLAAVQRKPGFAGGRLALDLDRLRAATGAMDRPDQYMEAAQLALQAGLPGDAKAFLDKGYAAGILGKGAEAERQKRLAEMARSQSVEDVKGLAELPKEAEGAATGLPWVRLGEAYAGYGRYDEAISALQKGIAKGGLDYPDDARLHLGIAYINAKRAEKAKATLSAVRAADGAQDLAQLWLIASGVK